MKPSSRITLSLVVMSLVVIGAFIAQHRATSHVEAIHVTAEQVNQIISAMPEQQRRLYDDATERERRLNLLRESLVYGAEARRLGFANRPENSFKMQLQRAFLLSTAYKEKHPDDRVTSEQIDEYFRRHPNALIELARYNPRTRGPGGRVSQRTRQQLGQIRILADRALKEGIDQDPGVALQLKYFPESILRESLINDWQRRTRVSDDEIRDYYRKHHDEFTQVRARHILFRTPSRKNARNGETASLNPKLEATRRRALDVLDQLREGGGFAALAREYSDDPVSSKRGGDLGYVTRGQMPAEFEEAAFKLEPGQISNLVLTRNGIHIIKVEDRRVRPLDESLSRSIKSQLREKKIKHQMEVVNDRYKDSIIVDTPPLEKKANKASQSMSEKQE